MKIMAIVDRHGLPLSVSTHAANHHEVPLVELRFDFYMIEAKPETWSAIAPTTAIRWMRSCETTALSMIARIVPVEIGSSNKIAIVVKATAPIEYLDVETTGFEQAGYGPETK